MTLLLCFYAFYNNFPLVYPDTGTYIASGFDFYVPSDRPLLYGLLVRHISLAESLWFVVLAQSYLLVISIKLFLKTFLSDKASKIALLVSVFLLTYSTGASVNVSQLIPDIFTPILFLLVLAVLFGFETMSWRVKLTIAMALILCICVHNSNLLILSIIILCVAIAALITKTLYRSKQVLIFLSAIGVFATLGTRTLHYTAGGGFSNTKGSQVFIFGRLLDIGVIHPYLQEACPDKDYKLCAYKDSLPWDYLWEPESPLYKLGGWDANADEYKEIIWDVLSTPKYLKKFLLRSGQATFKQFFTFETGDTPRLLGESSVFREVDRRYHDLVKEYLLSRQSNGTLNFEDLNSRQHILVGICLLFYCIVLFTRYGDRRFRALLSIILLLLLCNAAVCGALSIPIPRYQSRVIWLLPLPLVIFFFTNGKEIVSACRNAIQK